MRRYKVCFVDDEPIIPRVMSSLVDWRAAGFQVAGVATDGAEALELYERERPDLMFLDVKMPILDGISCARRIRERDRRIKLVLLTAYDSFEYARTGIELAVNGYLLKPVSREAVNGLVSSIAAELSGEWDEPSSHRDQRGDRPLRRVLEGLLAASEEGRGAEGDDSLAAGSYGLVDLHLAHQGDGPPGLEVLAEDFASFLEGLGVRVSAVAASGPGRRLMATSALPEGLYMAVESYAGHLSPSPRCSVYLLPCAGDVEEGKLPDRLAANAAHSFYRSDPWAGPFRECPRGDGWTLPHGEIAPSAQWALEGLDPGPAVALLQRTVAEAGEHLCPPDELRNFCHDLCTWMKMELRQLAADKEPWDEAAPGLGGLMACGSAEELLQRGTAALEELFVPPGIRGVSKNQGFILKANAFAARRYSDPSLSLEDAARHVGLSKNYLTRLYSQETGRSFWDYVTDLRIGQAKKLLRSTQRPMWEISAMTGYDSVYYFSRKFKAVVGVAPKEYRSRNRGGG